MSKPNDLAAQLTQLKQLYKQGLLSEANYRAAVIGLGVELGTVFEQAGQHVEQQINVAGNVYLGPPPRNRQEELDIYCRVVAQTCGQLPLRGVDVGASDPTAGQKPLGLANVYIDLDTRTQVEDEDKVKDKGKRGEPGEPKTRPLSALEATLANRRVVLTGDPGGGKTTFVHHVAHCLAAHLRQPQADWLKHLPGWHDKDTLPVLVTLRDFARGLPDPLPPRAEAKHLWNFIGQRLVAQKLAFASRLIEQALEQGRALVLLDGLDEVPTTAQRVFVRDAVTAFVERYPRNRYLATCRVLAYQPPAAPAGRAPDLRLPQFPSFELAAFDKDKIDHFIGAWYAELASLGVVRGEDAEGLARQLRGAVRRADLWRLAPNPLLLTVMALVHTHKGQLPDARALLYEETVDILLWRWEQVKAGGQEQAPRLRQLLREAGRTDVDLKRALWQLAFEAHATFPKAEGLREGEQDALADIGELKLQKALAALKDGDANWARQVMDTIKLRAGLLLERAPEVFTFPHRTFQEYLAGAHLAAQADLARQANKLAEQGALWREVILLAVGRLVYLSGDTDKPLALVGELCPAQAQDTEVAWRKAWLAGDVLNEIGAQRVCDSALGCDLLARVRERLVGLLGSRLAPRERAAAGNTLARFGDPRFRAEAWYLPDEPLLGFIEIPPGAFVMGEGKEQHTPDLSSFYIARYPVTHAQFAAFVQAGGYRAPRYWIEAQAAGVWSDGYVQGRYDDNQSDEPIDYGNPFNLANHPVVGVTWYEALAYCRWLTEQWQTSQYAPASLTTLLKRGWQIELPSEAEWEKAARGTQGTIYPWGDEINPNLANYDETSIGATSAVGCFPAGGSPYGCEDMNGNVWEWTRSIHSSYPYRPTDGRENLEADDNTPRVLRGGSFDRGHYFARCACRARYGPDFRGGLSGFRLVVSPISPTSAL